MATTSIIVPGLGYQPSTSWIKKDGDGGSSGPVKTGNTTKDGTSGAINTLFTVPPGAFGGFISQIKFMPAGENVQTVCRIFVNNGNDRTVSDNNKLVMEFTLPQTIGNQQVQADNGISFPGVSNLPPNSVVYLTIGTSVANGWHISCLTGLY